VSGTVAVHHRLDGPADAPVLLMSNSLGTTLELWEDQVGPLTERFRVLRYDQRGHGRSPVPAGPYSIEELGSDVLALLDRLELERVSLCGVSIGGMTALWIAANAPERLDRLVLCNTSAHLPPADDWRQRATTVRERGVEAVAEAVLGRWLTPAAPPEMTERLRAMLLDTPREGYAGCCEAIAGHDVRDRLGAIGAPTLVIAAEEDPAIPPEHGRALAEAIPGAQLELVPRAAHLPNVEQPQAITRALLDHLAAGART
jgi:3-oxoadipate enol-lactonase